MTFVAILSSIFTKSIRSIPYSFLPPSLSIILLSFSHLSHSRFQWKREGKVAKLRGNERSLIVEKFSRDRVEDRGLRGTFSNDDASDWQTFITFRSEVKPKANRKTISDKVNLAVHAIRGGVSRVCTRTSIERHANSSGSLNILRPWGRWGC